MTWSLTFQGHSRSKLMEPIERPCTISCLLIIGIGRHSHWQGTSPFDHIIIRSLLHRFTLRTDGPKEWPLAIKKFKRHLKHSFSLKVLIYSINLFKFCSDVITVTVVFVSISAQKLTIWCGL